MDNKLNLLDDFVHRIIGTLFSNLRYMYSIIKSRIVTKQVSKSEMGIRESTPVNTLVWRGSGVLLGSRCVSFLIIQQYILLKRQYGEQVNPSF